MKSCQWSAWAHSEHCVVSVLQTGSAAGSRVRQGPSLEELTVKGEACDRDSWQFTCAAGQGLREVLGGQKGTACRLGEESEGIWAGS